MTGTSLDGLDVALTRVTGTGLAMSAELVDTVSVELPDELRATLIRMAGGEAHPPLAYLRAARHLGVVHAQGCARLIARQRGAAGDGRGEAAGRGAKPQAATGGGGASGRGLKVDFVVAHGQTIWHAPDDRLSWQLFDPWPIVRALELPVCYDLRQADLVAGGEGAPITPIADPILYRLDQALVLNLGGIANMTHWSGPLTSLRGGDLGPCNLLIDPAVRALFPGQTMDRDGQLSGDADADRVLVEVLVNAVQQRRGDAASLGREVFPASWITDALMRHGVDLPPAVQLASVIAAVAEVMAANVGELTLAGGDALRVIGAGGGVKNPRLVREISRCFGTEIVLSEELGIPAEAREAMAFAVLGALSADGVPITLPRVTGATDPGVAGVWAYPGSVKLQAKE